MVNWGHRLGVESVKGPRNVNLQEVGALGFLWTLDTEEASEVSDSLPDMGYNWLGP